MNNFLESKTVLSLIE